MAPTVGRIVLVIVDPNSNNGAEIAPAIITRVWSGDDERATVNYRILRDDHPSRGDEWKSSARLYGTESVARAAMVEAGQGRDGMFAFWPPRV